MVSGIAVWCHWRSGLHRARPLRVPVGGGPPASRPRRELRSARRLVVRPGPATTHRHRCRALQHPPHLWGLMHWRMFQCFVPQRHPFGLVSTHSLVADEVLHPIGKIQPLLIGLNLPDQVESSLTGVILSRSSPTIGSYMEPTLRSITCRRGFRPQALSRGWDHGLERPQQLTYQGPQLRQILIVWPRESIDSPASTT